MRTLAGCITAKGPDISYREGEGALKGRGGSLTPTKRRLESFKQAERGRTKRFGVILAWELDILSILKGGTKRFTPS